jgi:hypothetical protein
VQYLHRDDRGSDKTAYENKRKAELERKYPGSSVEISTMPTLINFADRGPGSGTWKCYEIDLVRLKAQTELLGADSRYDPALLDYLAKMSTSVNTACVTCQGIRPGIGCSVILLS